MIIRTLGRLAPIAFLFITHVLFLRRLASASPLQATDHTQEQGSRQLVNARENEQAVFDHGFLGSGINAALPTIMEGSDNLSSRKGTFPALLDALDVMQSHFYTIWQGQWPDAIDWTAAVMGTQISATLAAMSETWHYHTKSDTRHDAERGEEDRERENAINRYFTQITSFYFGENAFSLRTQAYDDMLWVVLGWLESIKFINLHSTLHYSDQSSDRPADSKPKLNTSTWYARQFIPQFAHRAHLFYDLAHKGWDTSLCGGGMIWNPYLTPYKNAITNQLYIAASIGMYLHFPGDENPSPFSIQNPVARPDLATELKPAKPHDQQYLENAVEGYQWLKTSGMQNRRGLYVDGFHVKGWRGGKNGSVGSGKCDIRDEKVYTYNQGVILSGLRGLWEATGNKEYLKDGHELVGNVISATGWESRHTRWRWQWAGLGRNGVVEEACDSAGTCSQNGHTFKGIFFHHFTLFCAPLPTRSASNGRSFKILTADEETSAWHMEKCEGYGDWLRHNAQAAYVTRDSEGVFGTWWGIKGYRGDDDFDKFVQGSNMDIETPDDEGTDYRNDGVPKNELWMMQDDLALQPPTTKDNEDDAPSELLKNIGDNARETKWDPNDRGRGRTVETQSGGLAVLRALWVVVDSGSRS